MPSTAPWSDLVVVVFSLCLEVSASRTSWFVCTVRAQLLMPRRGGGRGGGGTGHRGGGGGRRGGGRGGGNGGTGNHHRQDHKKSKHHKSHKSHMGGHGKVEHDYELPPVEDELTKTKRRAMEQLLEYAAHMQCAEDLVMQMITDDAWCYFEDNDAFVESRLPLLMWAADCDYAAVAEHIAHDPRMRDCPWLLGDAADRAMHAGHWAASLAILNSPHIAESPSTSERRFTLLHLAARAGDVDFVAHLLEDERTDPQRLALDLYWRRHEDAWRVAEVLLMDPRVDVMARLGAGAGAVGGLEAALANLRLEAEADVACMFLCAPSAQRHFAAKTDVGHPDLVESPWPSAGLLSRYAWARRRHAVLTYRPDDDSALRLADAAAEGNVGYVISLLEDAATNPSSLLDAHLRWFRHRHAHKIAARLLLDPRVEPLHAMRRLKDDSKDEERELARRMLCAAHALRQQLQRAPLGWRDALAVPWPTIGMLRAAAWARRRHVLLARVKAGVDK